MSVSNEIESGKIPLSKDWRANCDLTITNYDGEQALQLSLTPYMAVSGSYHSVIMSYNGLHDATWTVILTYLIPDTFHLILQAIMPISIGGGTLVLDKYWPVYDETIALISMGRFRKHYQWFG